MSDHEVSLDVSDTNAGTDFSAALSPLGFGGDIGGGETHEYTGEYASVHDDDDDDQVRVEERVVQADGSVVIRVKSSGGKHLKKQIKKAGAAASAMATAGAASSNHNSSGAIQTGAWATGLFNCFDFCVPNCCMASFCPCISAAQIATRLGFAYQTALLAFGVLVGVEYLLYGLMFATLHSTELQDNYYYSYVSSRYVVTTYEVSSTRLSFWAYLAYLTSIIIFIAFWQLRTKVRERFALPGSCVEDFFVSFCCSCCALAQMASHTKSYKPRTCDFGAPDELPAYDA